MSTPEFFLCTSVDDIRASIECARSNGNPVDIDLLRKSYNIEMQKSGRRSSVLTLLAREIRRQEKAAINRGAAA